MVKKFAWSIDKNRWLKSHPDRVVCFEDIVSAIESGGLLDDIEHINSIKYPHQRMYVVLLNGHIYCVPYVTTNDGVFLKTAYPSRKLKSIYLTNDDHEQ